MPNPITPLPQTQLVGDLATQFINNSQSAMGTLQGSIDRIPSLSRRVRQLGGLRRVATENPLSAQTREILPVLTSLENSLFVQRYTNGDLANTPTAQELGDGIGNAVKIGTGIAEHLNQCCDDLRNRLIALKGQLSRTREDILRSQAGYARGINRRISTLKFDLITTYQSEKRKFLEGLEAAKEEWKDIIKGILSEQLAPISEKLETIDQKIDQLDQKLDQIDQRMYNRLNIINRNVLGLVDGVTHIEGFHTY